MKKIVLMILPLVLYMSCKKEAKVKLTEVKPLPVVYCYISPTDSVIRVKVNRSLPLFKTTQQQSFEPVSDAVVNIASANGNTNLTYNSNTYYYEIKSSQFPIAYGANYKLTVTMNNGDVATAETNVPDQAIIISNVSREIINEQYGTELFKVKFNDQIGTQNYYRVAMSYAQAITSQSDTMIIDSGIKVLVNDQNYDGQQLSANAIFFPPYNSDSIAYYNIYLLNCNSHYYNFHKSLENYSGENPFAEPSLIYTNVKGGLGCFSAYTKNVLRINK